MAQLLYEYEYVREFGEGVDRMYREMEEAGLPEPEYKTVAFMVHATIKKKKYLVEAASAGIMHQEQPKSAEDVRLEGAHHGFRRKGMPGGNTSDYSRGERESLTHQGNKEVISELKEIILKFSNEEVKVFIEYAECEKSVIHVKLIISRQKILQ